MVPENSNAPVVSESDRMALAARMVTVCKAGDLKAVQELLALDQGLANITSQIGRFEPLHYAARAGHTAVVQALLDAGANPAPFEHMLRNHMGITTVEIARMRGFEEVARLMEAALAARYQAPLADAEIRTAIRDHDLDRIAELVQGDRSHATATDDDGNTPLHRLAERSDGPSDLLDVLVNSGARLDAVNALGMTPAELTHWRNHQWSSPLPGRWGMLRTLLARGATDTIHLACARGDFHVVRAMLDSNPDNAQIPAPSRRRPLTCAAGFGHVEIVRLLLERGADPNAAEAEITVSYPLYLAAERNDLEIARLLLDHGCNPNASVDASGVALTRAADAGHREMVALLESRGAAMPNWYLYWNGDVEGVRALLARDPSAAQEVVSLANEHLPIERTGAILEMAFAAGADPAQVGNWPLYRALENPALLAVYLRHGVRPNSADQERKTLLHSLSRYPVLESGRLLLEHGANIHARDDVLESTPLAWAAMRGNAELVQFLLDNGARANLPGDQPWSTPLFWAEYRGHAEIVEILRRAGAR